MQLPNNSIGISDLLAYRECPRRYEFGMQRHTDAGEAPESNSPATAYGSAVHEAIRLVEAEAMDDAQAIAATFREFRKWLEPADLKLLAEDLEKFHQRDPKGVRTVAQEEDHRVPLMEHKGETIYFRFKLDKLYQRLGNDAHFVHVDYKSSKWAKSQSEVDSDLQMWAYNWGIHEVFPECERLLQVYDQLRYGMIRTRKSEDQRAEIKEWLKVAALAVLEDDDLTPTFNDWCPWCPIMFDCPEVSASRLSEYARSRIEVLAPTTKEGRKNVTALDPSRPFSEFTQELPTAARVRKVMERFERTVRDTVREMPEDERSSLGYALQEKGATVWDADALREVHELLGEQFYDLIGLTKTRLESYFGEDPETLNWVMGRAEKIAGSVAVVGSGITPLDD